MKLPQPNQKGFGLHAILPVLVIAIISVIGVHLLTASHAAPVLTDGGGGSPAYYNGKIYFGGITVNPDGSGLQRLSGLSNYSASFSSISFDGTQVVYANSASSNTNSSTTSPKAKVYVNALSSTGSITTTSTASLPAGITANGSPILSPDGKKIAIAVSTASGTGIWVVNADGTGGHIVQNVPTSMSGYISWRPGSENIVYSPYAVSATGDTANNSKFCLVSIGGKAWGCDPIALGSMAASLKSVGAMGDDGIAVSPDGNKIALVTYNNPKKASDLSADIYTVGPHGGGLARLTTLPKDENVYGVVWSPDGTKIAYLLDASYGSKPSDTGLYVMNADGSGNKKLSIKPALKAGDVENSLFWAHL